MNETFYITQRLKKGLCVFAAIIYIFGCVFFGLTSWEAYSEQRDPHFYPDYAQIDLTPILEKPILSDDDYRTIFLQTGLTRIAVDDYRAADGTAQIALTQQAFFTDDEYECIKTTPITGYELMNHTTTPLAPIQDGDILITNTSHMFGWRYGHSALITSARYNITIEAFEPKSNSDYQDVKEWRWRANFALLRPKASAETKAAVVQYAIDHLLALPYSFATGVLSPKYELIPKKTQCAHLVWRAYYEKGLDLDGNGGLVVVPKDFIKSDLVDIVQIYGTDPRIYSDRFDG